MKAKFFAIMMVCLLAVTTNTFAQYGWARNDKTQKMWNWPKNNYVGIGTTGPTVPFEVYGNSKFTGVTTIVGSVALTGTMTSTGIMTLSGLLTAPTLLVDQDKGTANIAVFTNDKSAVGDSSVVVNKLGYVAIGKATATVPLDVVGNAAVSGTLAVTGVTTLTGGLVGTAVMRGNAAFSTTLTRVAVYIPGAAATDYFQVTPIGATDATRPVAGDLLMAIAKTDSLIVTRQAGTTSGLSFDWLRIK